MKVILLLVSCLVALPVASAAAPDPKPVCVFDPMIWDGVPANACADVDLNPLCVDLWATVYSQHVYADLRTQGESFTTKPIHVGPLHVGSTTVTLDPVHVVTIDERTPQRGFTNDFCTTQLTG